MSELHTVESLDRQPFKYMVATIGNLPTSFVDSMSYYELLAWLCQYLQNTVVPAIDNNAEALEELQAYYIQLKEYVENYFENLDVQEEINNKLDEMASTGALQEIVERQYAELKAEVNQTIADNNTLVNQRITTLEGNTDDEINQFKTDVNNAITIQNNKISALHGFEPIVVSSTGAMTDQSRVYLLTTDSKWYYYNGTTWVAGGDYNTTAIADGSIDILKFDADLQDAFDMDYATRLDFPNELFQGYCGGTTTLVITQSAGYRYAIFNLENNSIYNFVGKDNYNCKALVVVDPNDSNKIVFKTTTDTDINNILFKVNQSGLKAYVSWLYQAYATDTDKVITDFTQGYSLSKLDLIKPKVIISDSADLVAEMPDVLTYNATVDQTLKIRSTTAASGTYDLYQYRMDKGKKYQITYSNYYLAKGLLITDKYYTVKVVGDSADETTIEYTATFDGFIYLLKNPSCTPVIKVENESIDIPSDGIYSILKGKTVVYEGDSITESRITSAPQGNGGAYPKLIADLTSSSYVNKAVGGGTLSHKANATNHEICKSLSAIPTTGDAYVFSGGINDLWDNRPLGTLSSDYTSTVDDTTVIGALEEIFRFALSTFVGKPIMFVITQKISLPYNNNTQGYNQFDLHDAIVSVCEKYSIPYYDAFNDSGLNGWNDEQKTAYLNANSEGTPDGTHPNEQGYMKYYVPQVIEMLNTNLTN